MESKASRELRQQAAVVRRAIRKAGEVAYTETYENAIRDGVPEAPARELAWCARQAAVAAMERNNMHNDWSKT